MPFMFCMIKIYVSINYTSSQNLIAPEHANACHVPRKIKVIYNKTHGMGTSTIC